MPRTAPAPNIPPIPGMCPSIAVLAGGGDGGGGSGKGAGNGKGNGSANPNGDGANANSDGKNAGGSGAGQGCGCPQCQTGTAAGDPIDVVSGRAFTNPWTDLVLNGPLTYGLTRMYSTSHARRDGTLGFGWAHSLGWELDVHRDHVIVWRADGTKLRFSLPAADGESVLGMDGWLLRKESWGWLLDCNDDLWRAFGQADPDDPWHFVLTAIQDRNQNRVSLTWDSGKLVEVVDSAGRVVRVTNTPEGRIKYLDMSNAFAQGRIVRFASYDYDDHGNLIAVTDADNNTRHYAYDDVHRLLSHTDPVGLTFYFRYDTEGRAVESWGSYPDGKDPSLADNLPRTLADGVTLAKGVQHVLLTFGPNGYSEVVDSTEVMRYFGNEFGKLDKAIRAGGVNSRKFDDLGFEVSHTDPLGATTTTTRDSRGRPLSMTNALGQTTHWRRDDGGRVISIENAAGGVVALTRDSRGNITTLVNQVGGVTAVRYDARGLIESVSEPNGMMVRLEHDQHGNLVRTVESNGASWTATYDYFGTRTSLTDPLGHTTRFSYSQGGLLLSIVDPDGATTTYSYDRAGHVTRVVDPDGTSVELSWAGYNCRYEIKRQDGATTQFRYDRDGRLVNVTNWGGDVHTRQYKPGGFCVAEKTFDGRSLTYKWDACGQLLEMVNGANEKTAFAYDQLGQLLERSYADGTSETFTYDVLGSVTSVQDGRTEVRFTRDASGNVVKESQLLDGEIEEIERSYDLAGLLTGRATTRGHTMAILRDARGVHVKDVLDGALELDYQRDLLGRALSTGLGAGGLIEDAYDDQGQLKERRVRGPNGPKAAVGDGQPQWIGRAPTGANLDKTYQYSVQGDLTQSWSLTGGTNSYEYDPFGQLLSRTSDKGHKELFRYDPIGNLHELSPGAAARKYDGPRLVEHGGDELLWDGDGRLAERVRTLPTGATQRWKYKWSAKGTLSAVLRPDGAKIEFVYDAFFRRVKKTVIPRPIAEPNVRSTTRFVWDEAVLVHEIRAKHDIVEERTYVFDDLVPAAHRDSVCTKSERTSDGWLHYVNDPAGTPEELVDARGDVVCALERSAWGTTTVRPGSKASTPIRFQGQYEDEETGLSYNQFRYYDPSTARYISADPVGLAGGPNPFSYVPNPLGYVDPMGLTTSEVTEQLATNMANDPVGDRTIGQQHQAHHIVPREHKRGKAGSARKLLRDHGIDIDEAANGARLKGRHKSNLQAGGHKRGCDGYHGTRKGGVGSVHSKSAYDTVNRRIQAAANGAGPPLSQDDSQENKDARAAAIRQELRTIGTEMETGTWLTDADKAKKPKKKKKK